MTDGVTDLRLSAWSLVPLVTLILAECIHDGLFYTPPPLSPAGLGERKGGSPMARPKGDPANVRGMTIGVRVTDAEYAALREKAEALHITPAQWLRDAALKRRLPSLPAPAINIEEYGKLARLSANLNQLVKLAHAGRSVTINEDLIAPLAEDVRRLRLALLGQGGEDE